VSAIVRDVGPLGALVGRVLGRVPRAVGGEEVERQAVAVLAPDGAELPQVPTIGPWTEAVEVGGSRLRAAAVREKAARELAAGRDRRAAVKLATEPPRGCAWAILWEARAVSVLCTRPVFNAGVAG
jgi:hypothetical protein